MKVGAQSSLHIDVQGEQVDLVYDEQIRPTCFTLFLAETMRPRPTDELACDIGAGGGALAVVLARLGVPRVIAVDRSARACEFAEENARRNGVAGNVEVIQAGIHTMHLDQRCDLIVSNPPTMPTSAAVPHLARGGGASGRSFMRALIAGLPDWLEGTGRAQVALSSLVARDASEVGLEGLSVSPEATMVAPFRDFYAEAYNREELDSFVSGGRAFVGGSGLSELIIVYRFEHSVAGVARGQAASTNLASPLAMP
jgi:SAM-dependent methyltransferase